MYALIKDKVTIHTDPVNPDMDAQGTGNYEIYEHPKIEGAVTLHDPLGHYLGSTWYSSIKHTGIQLDEAGKQQLATLCQTLLSKPHKTKNATTHNRLQHIAHMPGWVSTNLRNVLTNGQWNDALSTPLSISPGCSTGYAPDTQQAQMGASGTWFSTPWYGFHILHHVPKHLGAKAIRWAITSTLQTDYPTAIMALLPSNEKWSSNWITHHSVTPLMEINPSLLNTKKGVFQGMEQADSTHTTNTKHTLYLISNPTGRNQLFPTWTNEAVMNSLLARCDQDFPWTELHWLGQISSTQHRIRDEDPCLRPKALKILMDANNWSPPTHPPHFHIPPLLPLQPKWDSTIFSAYTDGSCTQTKHRNFCGAGIYLPLTGRRVTMDPRGSGETNTINRAELTALLGATHPEVVPLQQDMYIFTDSMCSQLQINKYLLQPEAFRHHLHKDMIRCIAEQIQLRAMAGGHTHIYKVKGHSGVKGNEEADAVAGLARQLVTEGKETNMHAGSIESEPRKQIYWPYHQGISLPNLTSAPRHLARQARQDVNLCKGIYERPHVQGGQEWARNSYKNIANADFTTRLHIARWNGGTLWNRKIEARNKGLPDWQHTKCLICNGFDGGTHILAGCKHKTMTGCYINRHNKAVRTLAKYIKHSTHPYIGKAVHIMDAGTPEDCTGFIGTRIPQWILPGDDTEWQHRPDMLLLIPDDDAPIPVDQASLQAYQAGPDWQYKLMQIRQDYRLLIIEVGFTSAHNLRTKDQEKQAQHTLLANKLYKQGWRSNFSQHTIDIVSIPLGVCGRFLPDTQDQLHQYLKLPYGMAGTVLQKMGKAGVETFVGIYRCKRQLDREAQAVAGD